MSHPDSTLPSNDSSDTMMDRLVLSYLAIRRAIGLSGLALPLILGPGGSLLREGVSKVTSVNRAEKALEFIEATIQRMKSVASARVPFSYQASRVAGIAQDIGDCCFVAAQTRHLRVLVHAQRDHAGAVRVASGQQGRSGGCTNARSSVRLRKLNGVIGEAIEVWRPGW